MNVKRVAGLTAAIVLTLALTACGPAEKIVMPDVVGAQLDGAKSNIERAGYGSDVEVIGGGMTGILDDSAWTVCEQLPAAGDIVSEQPRLTVERSCEGDNTEQPEEDEDPIEAPDESLPAPDAEVTETSVDELLDRLNSAGMGGIQTGDQFHFTGELVMSEYWMTGATGDFTVLFTAHGGEDDLFVFVTEADAKAWTDGTVLDMVVESVEVTIDGETTSGWLRAVSATVIG